MTDLKLSENEINIYKIDIEKVRNKGVAGGELCGSF